MGGLLGRLPAPIGNQPTLGYGTQVSECVRGYHLPGIEGRIATERLRFADVEVEILRLSSSQLHGAIDRARHAAAGRLRSRPVDEVLAVTDQVIANWVSPNSALRRLAERVLPPVTGFSDAMIRHGLPLLLSPLRADAIREVLDAELGGRDVLDQSHGPWRAMGPSLITHVLPGNIPGLAAAPLVLSLAVKSAALVKSAAGDPFFPALFAASIAEVDAEVGRCVLAAHWRGGDHALEAVAFAEAGLVVASGSDAAVAAIAAQVPARLIAHGHKVSFAAIGREGLADADAAAELGRRLAYDVSLWDQQGCLSPQLCYVEHGGRIAPARFSELLANGLSYYAGALPPRRLSLEEKMQVRRFRHEGEWRQRGKAALLASADSTDWTISIEDGVDFVPTCLNRCIRLKVVDSLSELPAALAPHRRHLEAAGIAVGPQRELELAEMLGACGVHRICPLGRMQTPRLSWRQGGRPRVAEWVEWVSVETADHAAVADERWTTNGE
jgi:hypothetical protein